jgi:hypothetical protein
VRVDPRPPQRGEREREAHDALPDQLPAGAQAERSRLPELREIVDRADDREPPRRREDEQSRRREAREADGAFYQAQMRPGVPERRGGEDDEASHRRRAVLHEMRLGSVLADQLTDTTRAEEVDDPRRQREPDDEGDNRSEEDALH